MGVVHGGGWFIRSSHVALIYSPKPRIYFIHYAFVGADKLAFWSPQEAEGRRPARLLARFGACLYPEPPTPNNQPSPRPGGCYSRLIGDTNQTGRGSKREAKVLRKDTGKATVPLEFPVGGTFNATAARKVPRKLL